MKSDVDSPEDLEILYTNGTPLQDSRLENPMDGGAWWAAVHGVTKSWARLSDFPFTFPFMHWRRKWQPTPVFLPERPLGAGQWVKLVSFSLLHCKVQKQGPYFSSWGWDDSPAHCSQSENFSRQAGEEQSVKAVTL